MFSRKENISINFVISCQINKGRQILRVIKLKKLPIWLISKFDLCFYEMNLTTISGYLFKLYSLIYYKN